MNNPPTAVLCTPLDVEHRALLELLARSNITEHTENGTIYEVTELRGLHTTWRLAITLSGRRNENTATALERAIDTWKPQILIVSGVAGGLRDSAIGDVIAAPKVYSYESGQDTDSGFLPRVDAVPCSHMLDQQAHRVAHEQSWMDRLGPESARQSPRVFHRPIAAGSKVVTGANSDTAKLISKVCGDAQGVDMEGYGAMATASRNSDVEAMVVRGVSDLLSDKAKSTDRTRQPLAARNAAAFALALIERCEPKLEHRSRTKATNGDTTYAGAIGAGTVANTGAIGPGATGHITINQHGRLGRVSSTGDRNMVSHHPTPQFGKARISRTRKSNATTHLCAAAYLDRDFRESVIEQVYARHDRAIAPNPGADAATVISHVLRARILDIVEQALLTAMLIAFLLIPAVDKLSLLICLGGWLLIGLKARTIGNELEISSNQRRINASSLLRKVTSKLTVAKLVLIVLALGAYLWIDVRTSGISIWVWLVALAACTAGFEMTRMYYLSRLPEESAPQRSLGKRIAYIGAAQRSLVITYSPDESEFTGFGNHIITHPLPLPLHPKDTANEPGPGFDIIDLNRYLKARIEALSVDSPATQGLPDLEVADQLFVSGREVTRPAVDITDLPASEFKFGSVEDVLNAPAAPVRHRIRCQVSCHGGEVVTTGFIYFALQGETLYLEYASYWLPMTKKDYHVFRQGSAHRIRAMLWCGSLAVATTPIDFLRSPYDSALNAWRGIKNTFRGRPALKGWRPPDCGARTSIRELGCDLGELERYPREAVKYSLILEHQLLEALSDFLDEHGVDTSALDDRITAIIHNQGVINYGEMSAGAIGAGATATAGAVGAGSTGAVQQPIGKG